ncbi:MAG: 50S ribosomal protein L35 [Rhodovibrionaceae bacterium]
MPKMKTKASAKKRFKISGSGKVRVPFAYKRHMLRRRPQKMKRATRGFKTLCAADTRIVKRHFLPNG